MNQTKIGNIFALSSNISENTYDLAPVPKTDNILDYYRSNGAATWGDSIFHYCSLDTCRNIIEHKKLRFSDVRFLNDTTEFQEVVRLVKIVLKEYRKNLGKELYQYLSDKELLTNLENYHQNYSRHLLRKQKGDVKDSDIKYSVYTCSFSMNQDLLSMWNYYADNAGGVNIRFSNADFLFIPKGIEDRINFLTGKVWYQEEEKKKCIVALLDDIKNLHNEFGDDIDHEQKKRLIQRPFANAINNMRIFMKDENFYMEEEYRIAMIIDRQLLADKPMPNHYVAGHFRRGNVFIPYIDVPFQSERMEHIKVAPTLKNEFPMIKLGLEDLLFQNNLANIDISYSEIPMRKY